MTLDELGSRSGFTTIQEHLDALGACEDAREWARQYQTAQEVWDHCDRISWLFWWASELGQRAGIAKAAKEMAASVDHLKHITICAADVADAAAFAEYATRTTYPAYYAVCAAHHATNAANFAGDSNQDILNLRIVKKHLACPWHEPNLRNDAAPDIRTGGEALARENRGMMLGDFIAWLREAARAVRAGEKP